MAGILVLGVLLRLPNLQTLPELTDEAHEVLWGLAIAREQSLPLTNYRAYDGALYNYLLAFVFRLVGSDLEIPRVVMLWLGLATLPLVCLCVRRAHGTAAGLLAAAMLAVSPIHIVVNSHVAWGNCLTPLLTTLAFWLVYRAIHTAGRATAAGRPPGDRAPAMRPCETGAMAEHGGRHEGAWNLAPAALLLGMALQTHPTVLALLPGVALAVALSRPRLALSRWTVLSLLAFLAGYSNMLVFNLQTGFQSFRVAQQIRAEYTGAARPFGEEYLENLGTLLLSLFRMVGGAIEDRAAPTAFLADPALLAAALVVVVGVAWAVRRGDLLPLLVTLSSVLLLPLANDRYEPITDGRYLAPLLPLLFGAASRLVVDAVRPGTGEGSVSRSVRAASLLALALLLLAPLIGLRRYNDQSTDIALRGERLLEAFRISQTNLPAGSTALVDRDLERVVLGAGSSELLAFEYAFTMRSVPHRVVRLTPGSLATTMAAQPTAGSRLVVLERAKRKLLDPRLQVRQLDADLPEKGAKPSGYGIYLMSWQGR